MLEIKKQYDLIDTLSQFKIIFDLNGLFVSQKINQKQCENL